jgi:membrane-associated phospholipid phosphatase
MRWRDPSRHVPRLLLLLALSMVFLVLTLLDRAIWSAVYVGPEQMPRLVRADWYQVLRQVGYLPVWAIVGAIFMSVDLAQGRVRWWARGVLLIVAVALSGLAAETVLGTVMRQRPGDTGLYWFTWLNDGWDRGPGHGFPSSHTATAFGAAFILMRMHRGAGWVMIPAAAGCALSRMLAGAHFATDVMGGALLAYLVCAGVWRMHRREAFLAGE